LDNKIKTEKVELVKQLIRKNNYRQFERTHQQCISLGITVNREALDRFAEKLELIDKAQKARSMRYYQHPVVDENLSVTNKQGRQQAKSQLAMSTQTHAPALSAPLYPRGEKSAPGYQSGISPVAVEDMTYEQVKKRETEITFELGALKIKESELLQELNSLSSRLKKSHRQ
jgi:hypothetical protein